MIIPVAALIAVLLPLVLGGRPQRMAAVRLRHTATIGVALLAQILIFEIITGPVWLLVAVHLASYAAAATFVWFNRRVPGLAVAGAGAASNGLAIAVNGGTLPADPAALARAGIHEYAGAYVNSGAVAHPRLAFLGDVFAVPAQVPLANVFSLGDLAIVLGAGYASARICGTRWTRPWNPLHGLRRHRRVEPVG